MVLQSARRRPHGRPRRASERLPRWAPRTYSRDCGVLGFLGARQAMIMLGVEAAGERDAHAFAVLGVARQDLR